MEEVQTQRQSRRYSPGPRAKALLLPTEWTVKRNQGPPVPLLVPACAGTCLRDSPLRHCRQVGWNQLFYYVAASGTSHSPCRVLGTFRLLYLCPIGHWACTGVLSETHLRFRLQSKVALHKRMQQRTERVTQVFHRGVRNCLTGLSRLTQASKRDFPGFWPFRPQGCKGIPGIPNHPPCNQPPHGQARGRRPRLREGGPTEADPDLQEFNRD